MCLEKQYKKTTLAFVDIQLKQAILAQQAIGWKVFLEGLMTHKVIKYQQECFERHFYMMKSTTWAKRAIEASWTLIMDIWQFCNEILQKPYNIDTMEGKVVLHETMRKEWDAGLSKLPILKFSYVQKKGGYAIKEIHPIQERLVANSQIGKEALQQQYYTRQI